MAMSGSKLLQTIVMAFVGTLFAMLLAFPLAFLAARNITRNRMVQPGRESASSTSCVRSTC
jgi:ABC-type phosphate/phosphonate transport system permease subunit